MSDHIAIEDVVALLVAKKVITQQDVIELQQSKIPIAIFANDLSPLEAVTLYLSEFLDTKLIARHLLKPLSTVKTALLNAKKKSVVLDTKGSCFNLDIFQKYPELSILEAVCYELSQTLGYTEIGRLMKKDPRTIWTTAKRAEKKVMSHE